MGCQNGDLDGDIDNLYRINELFVQYSLFFQMGEWGDEEANDGEADEAVSQQLPAEVPADLQVFDEELRGMEEV